MVPAVLLLTLLAQSQEVHPLPKFADYPVATAFRGTPAAPKFATPGQRQFRTAIRDATAKGPNFAGHYRIAEWGCGTGCVQIAVVDVQTGEVYDGPFGALPNGAISFDAYPADQSGISYRLDSSLLVIRGCPNEKDCAGYYYLWSENRFKQLTKTQLPR
jgi:hypothetical protein